MRCGYLQLSSALNRCRCAVAVADLPSLLLGVMIPLHLLVLQHFRNLDETAEMDALAVRNDHLLFQHAGVADVVRVVANVLGAYILTGEAEELCWLVIGWLGVVDVGRDCVRVVRN